MARNNSIPARTDLLKDLVFSPTFPLVTSTAICSTQVSWRCAACAFNRSRRSQMPSDSMLDRETTGMASSAGQKNKTTGMGVWKKIVLKNVTCHIVRKIPSHHQDDISEMQLKHAKTFPINPQLFTYH